MLRLGSHSSLARWRCTQSPKVDAFGVTVLRGALLTRLLVLGLVVLGVAGYTHAYIYIYHVCRHDTCICMHVCMYLYIYAFIYMCMCVYAYLCIDCGSWYQCFSVWTVSCMRMCVRVHMYAYAYVCSYIYMCTFLQ